MLQDQSADRGNEPSLVSLVHVDEIHLVQFVSADPLVEITKYECHGKVCAAAVVQMELFSHNTAGGSKQNFNLSFRYPNTVLLNGHLGTEWHYCTYEKSRAE